MKARKQTKAPLQGHSGAVEYNVNKLQKKSKINSNMLKTIKKS